MRPEISFVVPSYKSYPTIGATLDSILNQETSYTNEVIIVDSSGDGTDLWIKRTYPSVHVISANLRLFPGTARNRGAQESQGTYLAFVDADTRPQKSWLKTLLQALERDRTIQMVGGAVANANPDSTASRVLHWIEFSEFLPGLKGGFRSSLSSSNLLIRRQDFISSSGFDETFAMAEDLIFSQKLAPGLYFEDSAIVLHHHRSAWIEVSEHLFRLGYWSGRYRRVYKSRGAWLRRAPVLSWGLPFLRAAKIVARILRSNFQEGVLALLDAPFLLKGLVDWTSGFYRGVGGFSDGF